MAKKSKKAGSSKGVKVLPGSGTKAVPAKGGRKGGKGGGKGAREEASNRKLARREAREVARQSAGRTGRRAHGGDDARNETRQRLKVKALRRQLDRLPAESAERRPPLLELAGLLEEAGRGSQAIDALREALALLPGDTDYAVRGPLLCLLIDGARADEASELLQGPLFAKLLEGKAEAPSAEHAAAARAAVTAGRYSLALLSYISVNVLGEHRGRRKSPESVAEAEEKLVTRLRAAHAQNPFAAEIIAFAPAFEPLFPVGGDLPPASQCTAEELPLLEALEYCCKHRQLSVWLDTNDEVRRFVRETLFEVDEENDAKGDEEPPLAPLPPQLPKEPQVLARWRRAREEALELWGAEMSADGDSGEAEDEGGEEEENSESSDESMDSSDLMAKVEARRHGC